MDANTSPETGELGSMSVTQATDHLAGLLSNSEPAAPEEAESENVEELEATDEVVEEEIIDESPEEGEEVEYEAEAEEAEVEQELADYIEVDGEQISLDEVGKSYMRQADYTKKTQAVAEKDKALEAERVSISQEREHLKQMLEVASQEQADPVDWVQLATDDPLEYTRQRAIHDAKQAELSVTNAEKQRLAEIENQQRAQKMQQFVEQQKATLAEKLPEITSEKGAQYRADILTYMEGVGYDKQELSQLYDARAVILADKARKYDALMSKGKAQAKKVVGKPKVTRPGVSTSTKGKLLTSRKKAVARARNSGTVEDAVAAYLA